MPLPLALALSLPALFLFGVFLESSLLRTPYRRKMARYDEYVILVTFALGIFLQNLALPVFGPYNRQAPPLFKGSARIGELVVGGDRLTGALVAFLVVGILLFFLYRTYLGKGLRAVAQSPGAASIVGIKVLRMRAVAFGIDITLAGVAAPSSVPSSSSIRRCRAAASLGDFAGESNLVASRAELDALAQGTADVDARTEALAARVAKLDSGIEHRRRPKVT